MAKSTKKGGKPAAQAAKAVAVKATPTKKAAKVSFVLAAVRCFLCSRKMHASFNTFAI